MTNSLKDVSQIQLGRTSRRLTQEYEVSIHPAKLSQPIDVDIYLNGNTTRQMKNMDGYPFRSVENTIELIKELKSYGIHSITLRLIGKLSEDIYQVLNDHIQAFKTIRDNYPLGTLHITVDPFHIGLNDDGTWGIKNSTGQLDYQATIELISTIASHFAKEGADSILTLGRIDAEVEVTKKELEKIGSNTTITSFSQNTETKNAYMYLEHTPAHLDTGQKILVGNVTEMNLYTLIDIYDGTDTIIVKPIENFHLLTNTSLFLKDKYNIIDFLTSDKVKQTLTHHPCLKEKVLNILFNIDDFFDKCKLVKIGGYTVSGTYYLQKNFEKTKGQDFTFSVIDELLKNAISASNFSISTIIDRNALWYVKQMARQN
ncbi:delta-aminolevulinic acid dehydratase [Bacillus sp. CLL-7-23]|uniref:Delta-aminolevulinic acid dehydratase n=1 Tax=Bacillus changyiensis TaxID=3004103 RepID=A0ABT4X540_9BACI|nr:delta-aminolevulinic acid dehydratase [Bacillus changyiensis]MDA7027410.1 delta-aminolevulinic acid dehydratase [Bacillus changyiensis]